MSEPKLLMMLLGCNPKVRNTEQHDIYFTVATHIRDTVPEILDFWPEANGSIHIDAWREVTQVGNFKVQVTSRDSDHARTKVQAEKLFFINLGGYKRDEFDEFHYKMLIASADKASAISQAKQTAFYKHTRFEGAESHIDDKFGVDVDDVYQIEEILPSVIKDKYVIHVTPNISDNGDEMNLGYFKLSSL